MLKLASALCVALLVACSCTRPPVSDYQHKDRLYVEVYEPTVLVSCLSGPNSGYGSGVILDNHGVTLILTAAHVVARRHDDPSSFYLEVTDWINGKALTVPADILRYDEEKDLAILMAYYEAPDVAKFASRDPVLFEDCRISGIGLPRIPLVTVGEIQGWGEGHLYSSASVYWGYSGGALYIWDQEQDCWAVAGIAVQIGYAYNQGIPTLSISVSRSSIVEWLECEDMMHLIE